MSVEIHPTAVVAPQARLDEDVTIGPHCVVGPDVTLGARTRLLGHVFLDGWTTLGADCVVYPFAALGTRTQDLKFKGGRPGVRIGVRATIREGVTVHAATNDGDLTVVGDDNLLMAYVHVAHCCRIGSRVIIANSTQIAGHVVVEDEAVIEGMVGIVQFLRVGRLAFIGGYSKVDKDVPPFMIADGRELRVRGVNTVGMTRRGVSDAAQEAIRQAHRLLYRGHLTVRQALDRIAAECPPLPEIGQLTEFVRASQRGIAR